MKTTQKTGIKIKHRKESTEATRQDQDREAKRVLSEQSGAQILAIKDSGLRYQIQQIEDQHIRAWMAHVRADRPWTEEQKFAGQVPTKPSHLVDSSLKSDNLPSYSCDISFMGLISRKMEIRNSLSPSPSRDAPHDIKHTHDDGHGHQNSHHRRRFHSLSRFLKDQRAKSPKVWSKELILIRGTCIRFYRWSKISHLPLDQLSDLPESELTGLYSLQFALCGFAPEYASSGDPRFATLPRIEAGQDDVEGSGFYIRVRAGGEQFLLRALTHEGAVRIVENISMGIGVSVELDLREVANPYARPEWKRETRSQPPAYS